MKRRQKDLTSGKLLQADIYARQIQNPLIQRLSAKVKSAVRVSAACNSRGQAMD
jgi:hypothetical protein